MLWVLRGSDTGGMVCFIHVCALDCEGGGQVEAGALVTWQQQ